MSHQKIWNFNDPLNFIFDPTLIEFDSEEAMLKLVDNSGLLFEQDFSDDTGFTYDSDLVEFDSGTMKQSLKSPSNSIFGATYTNSINGSFGAGVLTGEAIGGASILNNKLDLAHNDLRHVNYAGPGNATLIQTGCIRFKLTPNYSGNPSVLQTFVQIAKSSVHSGNMIFIRHMTDGFFSVGVYGSAGNSLAVFSASWNPVAGTTYEIELNFDINAGSNATRLFIDGTQLGATSNALGTRSSEIGLFRVGSNISGSSISNFSIEDLVIFNTVQHTANYTAGYTIPENPYSGSTVNLPAFNYAGLGSIQSVDDSTIDYTGSPRLIAGGYYWNGSAWSPSDGSYAQANTPEDFSAHVIDFPVAGAGTVVMSVVFQDDSELSSISSFSLELTGQGCPVGLAQIEQSEGQLCDGIIDISESVTKPADTDILYYIKKGSSDLYYFDGAWIATDKTESKLNTIEQILEFKALLDLDNNPAEIKIVPVLISDNESATPSIESISLSYNYYKELASPNLCKVSGYLLGADLEGVDDGTEIRFWAKKPFEHGANGLITTDAKAVTTTKDDTKGWFEIYLVETETIEKTIIATVPYIDADGNVAYKDYKNITIPNVSEIDFNSLIEA